MRDVLFSSASKRRSTKATTENKTFSSKVIPPNRTSKVNFSFGDLNEIDEDPFACTINSPQTQQVKSRVDKFNEVFDEDLDYLDESLTLRCSNQ